MNVKFGIYSSSYPLDEVFKTATLAEKYGFGSLWLADHLNGFQPRLDVWSTLTAIALKTKRLKLGVGVTDVIRRHPAALAQVATTVDIISNGRLILGLGAGEAMNLIPYGIRYDKPVSRMIEAIHVIRKLWTQPEVTYSGKFYNLKNAISDPKPVQKPYPPIWLAANSPRTLEATAELADGWLPFRMSPELYKKELEEIKRWTEKFGRSIEEIERGLYVHSAIAYDYDSNKEPYRTIEEKVKTYFMFSPRRFEEIGYKPSSYKFDFSKFVFSKNAMEKISQASADIPIEAVKCCGVYGTPEACIQKIEEYVKAGVRYFVTALVNPKQDLYEAIKLYGQEVIPHFR